MAGMIATIINYIDINNYSLFLLFQPLDGFPVLHYVVSYNTSDNSTLIHTQVNSSMTSYTVSGVPGVTYYITVFAVNVLGPGPITGYSIVNGEWINIAVQLITSAINLSVYAFHNHFKK